MAGCPTCQGGQPQNLLQQQILLQKEEDEQLELLDSEGPSRWAHSRAHGGCSRPSQHAAAPLRRHASPPRIAQPRSAARSAARAHARGSRLARGRVLGRELPRELELYAAKIDSGEIPAPRTHAAPHAVPHRHAAFFPGADKAAAAGKTGGKSGGKKKKAAQRRKSAK